MCLTLVSLFSDAVAAWLEARISVDLSVDEGCRPCCRWLAYDKAIDADIMLPAASVKNHG